MLVLDFDPTTDTADRLREILESEAIHAVELRRADSVSAAAEHILKCAPGHEPAVIVLVLSRPVLESPEPLIEAVRRHGAEVPIVAVTTDATPAHILRLLELGIHDFISAPFCASDVLPRIWRLAAMAREPADELGNLRQRLGLRHLLGESASFLAAIRTIPLLALCDASVLICGETGTGKELVARAIHYLSPRAKKPFVAVNCGALPVTLVENELFGHDRAAYTGAVAPQRGVIQEAEGGTLLLDEVDTLPLLAQVKILRFLQEREYRPLGSPRVLKADVRVLAASNRDLEQAIREGRFRQDLYYRLNVIPLRLPALRERREDISRLARHFLRKHRPAQSGVEFSGRALQVLLEYDWPGNVRELEHVVERAALLSGGAHLIREQHVILGPQGTPPARGVESFHRAKADAVARFEAGYVRELLAAHHGNISRAARAADKNRRAFWELIRKYHIDVRTFRTAD